MKVKDVRKVLVRMMKCITITEMTWALKEIGFVMSADINVTQ